MAVLSEIHEYILDLIENKLSPGAKLPGARSIAEHFSCSLPRVQTVLDLLEQSGVVESRPRSGTYVSADYKERLLLRNVVCSKFSNALTGEQRRWFRKSFPELHLTGAFHGGGVEILSSFTALTRRQHYQDLSEIFQECFPDGKKRFFTESLSPFYIEGKLFAIPVMFSPQILWYNPDLFRQAGVSMPENDWGKDDFLSALRQLHKRFSGRRVINFSPHFQQWSRFVHGSGALFFDPALPEPVQADSPKTLEVCLKYLELLRELDLAVDYDPDPIKSFAEGKLALFSGFRQSAYYFREHGINFTPGAVLMPDLGSGEKQLGAALIGFRNNFYDREKIKELLQFWLSDSIQETLGISNYGVPFLRSAAGKTLDPAKAPDCFLLDRIPALNAHCQIPSEELGEILMRSSFLINSSTPEQLPQILKELATTMRFIFKLRNQSI